MLRKDSCSSFPSKDTIVRNPGRASLFEAALQSNEYLRSIPKGLKWQASNGLADSDIAYSLLRLLPQVKKVIFGSVALFPREYRTTGIFLEMIALQLTSFTFYASDFNSSIEACLFNHSLGLSDRFCSGRCTKLNASKICCVVYHLSNHSVYQT